MHLLHNIRSPELTGIKKKCMWASYINIIIGFGFASVWFWKWQKPITSEEMHKIIITSEDKVEHLGLSPRSELLYTHLFSCIVTGHCYAGGAIRALAHDYRVMRTKRGWFCLPEVNLGLQFSEANILLMRYEILHFNSCYFVVNPKIWLEFSH